MGHLMWIPLSLSLAPSLSLSLSSTFSPVFAVSFATFILTSPRNGAEKPESARNQSGRRTNGSIITSSQKNKNVTAWPFNASLDLIPLTSDSSNLEDCFSLGLYLRLCLFLRFSSSCGGETEVVELSRLLDSRWVVVACCQTFIAFECQAQNFTSSEL